MVTGLLHPLNIFILGLGGGFLIPLFYRLGRTWVAAVFVLCARGHDADLRRHAVFALSAGRGADRNLDRRHDTSLCDQSADGSRRELSSAFSVNLIALLGAVYVVREKYGVMLLYLLLVMGIQGMVMTRDLFNLFVFLEIVSVATYGLLSLQDTPAALSATFKYLMATVLASTFFLIGTVLLYAVTGMLNIDDLIANRDAIAGPIGFAALMFLLACLLLELKPFPANGWGLDVYETARSDVAALISGGVSAGVFFALLKLLPLFEDQLELIAALGAVTFLFSNLIGLRQTKAQRLLGYSSVGQMGLLTMAACSAASAGCRKTRAFPRGRRRSVRQSPVRQGRAVLAGGLCRQGASAGLVHAVAKPAAIFLFGILLAAISGSPPFPAFWAKWQLVMSLAAGERYVWIAIVLVGSLLEAAYLFRWFGQALHSSAKAAKPRREAGCACCQSLRWPCCSPSAAVSRRSSPGSLAHGCSCRLLRASRSTCSSGCPARDRSDRARCGAGRRPLAHPRSVRHQRLFAVASARGWPGRFDRLPQPRDRRPGFYPFLAVMLLSLAAHCRATTTSLEFFFVWELITLSSYFLILRRREAAAHAFATCCSRWSPRFFCLLDLRCCKPAPAACHSSALRMAGPDSAAVFVLLAIGLPDQGGGYRRPCLAAGRLCRGRR